MGLVADIAGYMVMRHSYCTGELDYLSGHGVKEVIVGIVLDFAWHMVLPVIDFVEEAFLAHRSAA